jgi:hypothetical protein
MGVGVGDAFDPLEQLTSVIASASNRAEPAILFMDGTPLGSSATNGRLGEQLSPSECSASSGGAETELWHPEKLALLRAY